MTKQHRIGSYKDGYVNVAYCLDCGKEGQDLILICEGEKISPDQLKLFPENNGSGVDKEPERN